MRYKTDLKAVQSVAKSLLYTTVHETDFSPMVVQHPFTSSAFVAIKRNGEMDMFSILENKENLHKWQDFMSKQISNTENVYQIFMMVNKPYALTFLKFAADNLSFEDFSKILNDAWVMSENPNCDANVSMDELVKFFKAADPEYAKKVTDSIPVGFYGDPEDCAGIVSLLCSDEGRYITGQNIFVDGGKSVQ